MRELFHMSHKEAMIYDAKSNSSYMQVRLTYVRMHPKRNVLNSIHVGEKLWLLKYIVHTHI